MKKHASNFSLPLKNLLKHRSLDNTTRVSYSVGLGCGPGTCISNKLSGDAQTASMGPTVWQPVIESKLNVKERGYCKGWLKDATEPFINQGRNCMQFRNKAPATRTPAWTTLCASWLQQIVPVESWGDPFFTGLNTRMSPGIMYKNLPNSIGYTIAL